MDQSQVAYEPDPQYGYTPRDDRAIHAHTSLSAILTHRKRPGTTTELAGRIGQVTDTANFEQF